MKNIILCGGSGTRLWPISRELYPKQFIQLFDQHSLFQMSVLRNQKVCSSSIVVSNTEQYFLARDQLERIGAKNYQFVLESIGRNTAPAVALVCFQLNEDEVILVTPSDHVIKQADVYAAKVREAGKLAEQGFLVTIGLKPTCPDIGYGYIEAAGNDVVSFHEKPELPTAKRYVEAGNFYWNSGILVCKAGVFLQELQATAPEIYQASKKVYENTSAKEPQVYNRDDMLTIPDISIDYAILEKSNRVKMIEAEMGWSDLGSFDALSKELAKDDNGNTSTHLLVNINSENNLILSERIVAAIDIQDLIIIDTPDALLVSQKGSSAKVKEVVKQLQQQNSSITKVHLTAYRPWGSYTVLEESERYKIKRIVVKPGCRLSLQKHFHRNEHWVVVSGTAKVTIGESETILRPNESTYIHLGDIHRLENPGRIDVVLIEVQIGDYLEEDDIIRIEDEYNRMQ